jgi:hypothetical protein
MSSFTFLETLPNEERCRVHFRLQREQRGIVCKHCGQGRHYWMKAKQCWQCVNCRFRTTLRSGSVMQGSNLPVRKWYQAMALMTANKKGISAKEMQRQLKHRRYDTIWSLMHRIRNAMGNRDDQYSLKGIVQFDDSFLLKAKPDGRKLKRGRRTCNPTISVNDKEICKVSQEKVRGKYPRSKFTRIKVRDSSFQGKKGNQVDECIEEKVIVFSKKSPNHINIADHVDVQIINPQWIGVQEIKCKWLTGAVDQAKRNICSVYHRIKFKYLQLYLDEFCYRWNRSKSGKSMFSRLCIAVAKPSW